MKTLHRILILLLATLMFAMGWVLGEADRVIPNKGCVMVIINLQDQRLVDVINHSRIPIDFEISSSLHSTNRSWTVEIREVQKP